MAHGSGRKKTCFVVTGFGEKTDFQSNPQRVLDLNRSFEDIIAPAVADCGADCIRADTLIHSTLIDKAETDRPGAAVSARLLGQRGAARRPADLDDASMTDQLARLAALDP